MAKQRGGAEGGNAVQAAVRQLGGLLKASVAGDVALNTTKRAITQGRVQQVRMACLWADRLAGDDAKRWRALVRQLAGIEP